MHDVQQDDHAQDRQAADRERRRRERQGSWGGWYRERARGVVADAMFFLVGSCLRASFVDGAGAGGGTFVGIARERRVVGAWFDRISYAHGGGACESAVGSFWKNGTHGVSRRRSGRFLVFFHAVFVCGKRSRSVVRPRPAVLRCLCASPWACSAPPPLRPRLPLWMPRTGVARAFFIIA